MVSGRLESDGLFLCLFPKQPSSVPLVRKSTDPKLKEAPQGGFSGGGAGGLFGLDPCRLCWGSFGRILGLGCISGGSWGDLEGMLGGVSGLVLSSSWADALPPAIVQETWLASAACNILMSPDLSP